MKKFTGLLALALSSSLLLQPAMAQEERTALVPLPSVDDFTRGQDGWAFGLGLGIEI